MLDKKKKIVLFGGLAAVCLVGLLILAVALRKDDTAAPGQQHSQADNGSANEQVSEAEPEVEMTTYEDGSYPLEKAMAQVAGYDQLYAGMAEFFQTMYTGGSTGFIEGAGLPDVGGSTSAYDPQSAIVFTAVSDRPDAREDLYVSDGTYGYLVKKDQSVAIVALKDAMAVQSAISGFEHDDEYILDLCVEGDHLILITSYSQSKGDALGTLCYYTMVYTYQIADRTQPVLLGSVELEGYYMGSRMTEQGFFVYSGCHKDGFISADGTLIPQAELEPSAYVPSVNGTVISAENVYMPEKVTDNFYMTAAVISEEAPEEPKDVKAFLSVDAQYYPGEQGLILLLQNGLYQVASTVLVRLDFIDGATVVSSAGAVSGEIVGTGGISESQGLLTVVSSDHLGKENKNYLYVLDQGFGIAAKKDDLADGELIQSVRFIHDRLYLATYGEKPIVAVDLSDTTEIEEYTYAKPAGFDGLLCEFGEDRILGLGYRIDETTMAYSGIRLTVFDVSDDAEIRVEDTADIQADTTPAATDPMALFVDPEYGFVGLSTEDWDEGYTHVDNFYRVFSYTENEGLTGVLEAALSQGNGWKSRGFFADTSHDSYLVMDQDAGLLKRYDSVNGFAQTGEIQY